MASVHCQKIQYYSFVGYHRLYIKAASVSVHFYPFVDFASNILSFQQVLCTAYLAIATIGSASIEGSENVVLRLETPINS